MKEIGRFMYDETGICPKCGAGLVPVPVFRAKLANSNVKTRIEGNQRIRTTTNTYYDIVPLYAGWCQDCEKEEFDRREEERAQKLHSPKPVLLILSAVILALGLCGLVYMIATYSVNQGTGAINGIGMISLLIGLPLFIGALVSYLKKKKLAAQYESGYRADFSPMSEEGLSSLAAGYMDKTMHDGFTYLSIGQQRSMRS